MRTASAVRHRLLGVREHVQEHDLQRVAAPDDGQLAGPDLQLELDVARHARPAEELHRLAGEIVQTPLHTLVVSLPGEVDDRADDVLDLEAALLHEQQALVRLRARLRLGEQKLEQAEDGEQRVVDLVDDTRSELPDCERLAELAELDLELLGRVAGLGAHLGILMLSVG